MQPAAELGFLAFAFAQQPGLAVRGAFVRRVAALFAVEVHAGVAGIAVGGRLGSGLGLETLEAGPRVDERAVHGEVGFAHPAVFAGQPHDARKEQFGGAVLEQAVLVLAEGGVVPHGVQQVQVEEPAEEQVVVERFDQQNFGADGVEGLQHFGLEQAFGREGGPAQLGIHLVAERREVAQDFVHEGFDLAQRVVLGHAARGRKQAQHVGLGIHLATHAVSDSRSFSPFTPPETFSMNC